MGPPEGELLIPKAAPEVYSTSPADKNLVRPVVHGLMLGYTQAPPQKAAAERADFRGDVAPSRHKVGGGARAPETLVPHPRVSYVILPHREFSSFLSFIFGFGK